MSLVEWITTLSIVRILGMGFLALGAGVLVGFLHRTYMNARVPFYATIIVGLGAIGLWINSASALITFVANTGEEVTEPLVIQHINTNTVTVVVGTIAAYSGGLIGDRLAPNMQALFGATQLDREVSKLVRTVGRVIAVTIPDRIEDIDGYEAVDPETKTKLAGTELIFPRGLTVNELRERIADRLREDYGIGHVDVEVAQDGEIEYLALGSREAGIGPSLPPRRVALAVTANPPPKASPGDRIQLWSVPDAAEEPVPTDAEATADPEVETSAPPDDDLGPLFQSNADRWYRPDSDRYPFAVRTPTGQRRYVTTSAAAERLLERYYGEEEEEVPAPVDRLAAEPPAGPERVATAELRATTGDVATVAIDVSQLEKLDQSDTYALVTLPASRNPDREFASLLRSANETMESIRIRDGSDLEGVPIEALQPSVVAIKPRDGRLETIPETTRPCRAGDTLYVIGRHDELRKLQATGRGSAT